MPAVDAGEIQRVAETAPRGYLLDGDIRNPGEQVVGVLKADLGLQLLECLAVVLLQQVRKVKTAFPQHGRRLREGKLCLSNPPVSGREADELGAPPYADHVAGENEVDEGREKAEQVREKGRAHERDIVEGLRQFSRSVPVLPAEELFHGSRGLGPHLSDHDETHERIVAVQRLHGLFQAAVAAVMNKRFLLPGLLAMRGVTLLALKVIPEPHPDEAAIAAPRLVQPDFQFLPVGREIPDPDPEQGREVVEDVLDFGVIDEDGPAGHGRFYHERAGKSIRSTGVQRPRAALKSPRHRDLDAPCAPSAKGKRQ